jgi:hypothetical protein
VWLTHRSAHRPMRRGVGTVYLRGVKDGGDDLAPRWTRKPARRDRLHGGRKDQMVRPSSSVYMRAFTCWWTLGDLGSISGAQDARDPWPYVSGWSDQSPGPPRHER